MKDVDRPSSSVLMGSDGIITTVVTGANETAKDENTAVDNGICIIATSCC